MICKPGEKYDHLTIIGPASVDQGHKMFLCKCDCGREVRRNAQTLTRPRKRYRACGYKDCKYSRIINYDQDLEHFEKRNAQNYKTREERSFFKKPVNIDSTLANIYLNMAWR